MQRTRFPRLFWVLAVPLLTLCPALAQVLTDAPGSPVAASFPRSITYGDFNGDGIPDMAVGNADSTVTIFLGHGDGSFTQASGSPIAVSGTAYFVAAADVNQDGKLDLVVLGEDASKANILLGNGQGQFTSAPGSPFATGSGPRWVAIGDFNGDNKPDLAIVNSNDNNVRIYSGAGDGTFLQLGAPIQVGVFPQHIVAADFNGDGKLDLATANTDDGSISILSGNGSGGFSVTSFGVKEPYGVAVADFNRDGKPDIAVCIAGDNTIAVFLNNGSGAFTQSSGGPYPIVGTGYPTVADMNGDGNPDILVSNSATYGGFSVLLGDGTGNFAAAAGSPFAPGNSFPTLAVADLNNDGLPDVAAVNAINKNVSVLLNRMNYSYTVPRSLTFYATAGQTIPVVRPFSQISGLGANLDAGHFTQSWMRSPSGGYFAVDPTGLSAGTYSGTGRFLGTLTPLFGKPLTEILSIANTSSGLTAASGSPFTTGGNPIGVAQADFNGDGVLDVAVADAGGTVRLLIGNGSGGFTGGTTVTLTGINPHAIVAGDFNGDGHADLAVLSSGNGGILILLGNGQGGFSTPIGPFASAANGFALVAGDFNNDGILDLASSGANGLQVLLGTGFGTFYPTGSFPIGGNGWSATTGDFNGDGNLDVAVANQTTASVTVLLGNGLGGFTSHTVPAGNGSTAVVAGYFNADSRLDLAVANAGDNTISILLGDGLGGFTNAAGSPFSSGGAFPEAIGTADFDGDGQLDLVVANVNDPVAGMVKLFKGNGGGGFTAQATYSAGNIGYSTFTIDDFNKDGRQDIAFGDFFDGKVSVLLGTPPAPAVSVQIAQNGAFSQGQQNATYSITVSNAAGAAATSGQISIQEQLLGTSGITPTGMSGSGWNCAGNTFTCTRSDTLAGGSSYPPITVTANVGPLAPASVDNSVQYITTTSGGIVHYSTTVTQLTPIWTISSSHNGNFQQGQNGAQYTVVVKNTGQGFATTGSMTETIPAGLSLVSISASDPNWTCAGASCGFNGLSPYFGGPITFTVTVNVSSTAPASVTNSVSFTANNGPAAMATDPTTITAVSACSYSLSPASASSPAGGGAAQVGVTAGSGCAWTASANNPFLHIDSGTSGSGNGTVSYHVDANTAANQRSGSLTIAGQSFVVTQAAACAYSLSPPSTFPGPSGGAAQVFVTASAGCPWTATTSDSFLHIDSGASGSGSGTVNYHVDANPLSSSRTGTILIAGIAFTVTEAGASCTASFSPTSLTVPAGPGSGTTQLTIGGACSWTAQSDSWWLNLTGATSGSGPVALPYTNFSNVQTTARTGNIVVNGSAFALTEYGSTLPYATREVTLLYQAFLSREPDSSGLSYWITQPAQNLGAAFYLSNEFKVVQLNLVQLYRAFYGREPDYTSEYLPGVRSLRTGAMGASDLAARLVTANQISSTPQLIAVMCGNVNPGANASVVSACVNASAGLTPLTPAAAAVAFIQSSSYQGVQSAQRDGVFLMYTITLNRPPDSGGFTYWLNTMTQNNYDTLWLVTAFVISNEFQTRLN
jgi:uncharacterized repeat protein (TIGR01451 family)